MRFTVMIAGRSVELELDGDRVTVDGQSHSVSLGSVGGTPLRQLLIDGRPLAIALEPRGRGRWAVTAAGERWELEVLDERTRHIRSLTGSADVQRSAQVLKAPMPGLVVRVETQPGDKVSAGAGLVVLEAMKMENELKAASAGTIKAVRVTPGEAVEKGQVLVEFEDGDQASASGD